MNRKSVIAIVLAPLLTAALILGLAAPATASAPIIASRSWSYSTNGGLVVTSLDVRGSNTPRKPRTKRVKSITVSMNDFDALQENPAMTIRWVRVYTRYGKRVIFSNEKDRHLRGDRDATRYRVGKKAPNKALVVFSVRYRRAHRPDKTTRLYLTLHGGIV